MRRVALALCAFSVLGALSSAQDDDPLAKEIRAATSKACAALAKAVTPPPPNGALPREMTWSLDPQVRPLVALALLRAGGADEKKVARKLLDDWWHDNVESGETTTNYELALAISAHEGLTVERLDDGHPTTVTRYEAKPIAADVKERLALLTKTLIAGRHSTVLGKGCGWSYDTAPWQREATVEKKDPRTTRRGPPERPRNREFDNSNTQFSVLALHDAARGGVAIPADVVKEVAQHFLGVSTHDRPAGGTGKEPVRWGYVTRGMQPSMTFAGLSSLGIARDLGYHDEAVDRAIQDALVNLGGLVERIPQPAPAGNAGFGPAYDLYSLEKALDTLEVKELDGKDWFAPLAQRVLKAQNKEGLWGSGDLIDSSLYVLFLTRATVSRTRLVDARSTGPGSGDPLGEVFLAKTKKTVDAVALLRAYAEAKPQDAPSARAAAEEALLALEAEGHGREACLLGPLAAAIRKGGDRKETAQRWLRDVCGRVLPLEDLDGWDGSVRRLAKDHDAQALRAALGEKAPLPVRAWAASELAKLQSADAAADVIAATDTLALEVQLETPAGARCARAFADALTGLTSAALPALPAKGSVSQAELRAVADAAREKVRRALDDRIDRALAAYDKKDPGWPALKAQVSGKRSLARMLEKKNFRLLRAVTGELIPDETEVWKKYLGV